MENVSLFDYKVRILDEKKGTKAKAAQARLVVAVENRQVAAAQKAVAAAKHCH